MIVAPLGVTTATDSLYQGVLVAMSLGGHKEMQPFAAHGKFGHAMLQAPDICTDSEMERLNPNDLMAGGLAECVRVAVERYLDDLGDHDPDNLHRFVLGECERPLIGAVLVRTDGNQSRAAQMLGISRGTLRKKIKELKL